MQVIFAILIVSVFLFPDSIIITAAAAMKTYFCLAIKLIACIDARIMNLVIRNYYVTQYFST